MDASFFSFCFREFWWFWPINGKGNKSLIFHFKALAITSCFPFIQRSILSYTSGLTRQWGRTAFVLLQFLWFWFSLASPFLVKNWSSGNSCLPSRFWWTLRKALRYLTSSLILALINPSGWLPNSPVRERLVGPSSLWDGESTERWALCGTEGRMRACECLRCGGPKPVDRGAYVNRSRAWCIAVCGYSVI